MTNTFRIKASQTPSSLSQNTMEDRAPVRQKMNWGETARSAPISPTRRVPNIDRNQVDPEILEAAEGMEALFLDQMLKIMRETIPKNDLDLESPATDIYRGMLDSQFAQKAAHRGGIGLAEPLIDYLQAHSYTQKAGHEVSSRGPRQMPMETSNKNKEKL